MRRDINIRKRKKIIARNMNKKCLITLTVLTFILLVCFAVYISFFRKSAIENKFEQSNIEFANLNENIPFSFNKITLFSSATAESNSINEQLALNISQYSDIALHLNKISNENITISSLYIDNIILKSPEIGTPYLYRKNINDLGKCSFNEENIIENSFNFNIVDTNKDINYENFEIYNNGSTPFSFGFFNKNIKVDFFPDESKISYNGTLLKNATILTTTLKCNITLRVNIITSSDEHYICNLNLDIPFEDENGSIYENGYVTKELEGNEINKFIRIK